MSSYERKAWYGGIELREHGTEGASRSFTVAYADGEVKRRWVEIHSGMRGDFVTFGMWPPKQQVGGERDPPIAAFEAMWTGTIKEAFDWLVGGFPMPDYVTVREWHERSPP